MNVVVGLAPEWILSKDLVQGFQKSMNRSRDEVKEQAV
jgi:hypothetical protein